MNQQITDRLVFVAQSKKLLSHGIVLFYSLQLKEFYLCETKNVLDGVVTMVAQASQKITTITTLLGHQVPVSHFLYESMSYTFHTMGMEFLYISLWKPIASWKTWSKMVWYAKTPVQNNIRRFKSRVYMLVEAKSIPSKTLLFDNYPAVYSSVWLGRKDFPTTNHHLHGYNCNTAFIFVFFLRQWSTFQECCQRVKTL